MESPLQRKAWQFFSNHRIGVVKKRTLPAVISLMVLSILCLFQQITVVPVIFGENEAWMTPRADVVKKSFQLASKESYGFFDDIPEHQWKRHQDWARKAESHRHPEYSNTSDYNKLFQNEPIWYLDNYGPIFNCPELKRIGSEVGGPGGPGLGDGPKWTCDVHRLGSGTPTEDVPHHSPCLIYSIGSYGNYEWEDGMVQALGNNRTCEIHIFDPSDNYDRPQNKDSNMHFHQWGLKGSLPQRGGYVPIEEMIKRKKKQGGEFITFAEILRRLGHEGRRIDIFKIDCEGCEFDSYTDWIGHDLRQVLVETHRIPRNRTLALDYFNSFQRNNLIMYSKEMNPWGGGNFVEFSYVKLHPDFLNGGAGGGT